MKLPRFAALALAFAVASLALPAAPTHAEDTVRAEGPLDQPVPPRGRGARPPTVSTVDEEALPPARGVTDQASLEREARREQEQLEQLERSELEKRAEDGERGAQVALANDYAREAERLAFSPSAANDALSDAVRWYATAASQGFPGAPSLDRAGIEFQPIRAQRPRP